MIAIFSGVGLLVGGLVGWQLGRSARAEGNVTTVTGKSTKLISASIDDLTNAREEVKASAVQVEQWRNDPGSLKAKAKLIAHAASLDLQGVRAALEASRGQDSPNDWVFTQALLERWAELDVEDLLEESNVSTDYRLRWQGYMVGFRRLAETDVDAAWARAEHLGVSKKQDALMGIIAHLKIDQPQRALELIEKSNTPYDWLAGDVISQWSSRDPGAAVSAVQKMKTGEIRTNALQSLARSWAQRDPDAALAWSKGLANVAERHSAVGRVLHSISEEDPDRAMSMLNSGSVDEHRSSLVRAVASTMARRDFDGALQFALSQNTFSDKSAALSSVTHDLSKVQADQLMELAKTLPVNLAKTIYESGIWQMSYGDPELLGEWIEQIPVASIRETVLKRSAENLAWRSPDIAKDFFDRLQPSAQDSGVAARIASHLAASDPKGAADWAAGMDNVANRKEALSSAVQSWANRDPEGAKEYIQNIENPDVRRDTMASLSNGIASRNLKEAEQWALSLEGADRSAALATVVKNAAHRDPEHAPELYETFVSGLGEDDINRSEYHQVASAIANQMAQTEPGRAVEWLGNLPQGKARDEAMGGLAAAWASHDPYATSEWLGQQEPGSGRDKAAKNLVSTIARDDPESAWQWATAIGEASLRRDAASTVIEAWKSNGRSEDAAAALGSSGGDLFTTSELEELAKKLD